MIQTTNTNSIKFQIVADLLKNERGQLVDVGARDRILYSYLHNPDIEYRSADMTTGHDLQWNLEQPIPANTDSIDYVVAFDVLEHLDHFHDAFHELMRVTRRRLFISLPNMSHLSHRLRFFATGFISAKYSLLPDHQGDRHRWLTHYDDIVRFVEANTAAARIPLGQYNWIRGYSRLDKMISWLPVYDGLKTYTVIFDITKCSTP